MDRYGNITAISTSGNKGGIAIATRIVNGSVNLGDVYVQQGNNDVQTNVFRSNNSDDIDIQMTTIRQLSPEEIKNKKIKKCEKIEARIDKLRKKLSKLRDEIENMK
jgi:hypothetical protein